MGVRKKSSYCWKRRGRGGLHREKKQILQEQREKGKGGARSVRSPLGQSVSPVGGRSGREGKDRPNSQTRRRGFKKELWTGTGGGGVTFRVKGGKNPGER